MAKVNYTKVEEALISSQQKAFIDHLDQLATLVSLKEGKDLDKISDDQITLLMNTFQKELKQLKLNDPTFYADLGLTESQETHFFSDPRKLTSDDWGDLIALKEKMGEWKKNLKKSQSKEADLSDADLIEKTRKRQKQARFNVNSKWMPLS